MLPPPGNDVSRIGVCIPDGVAHPELSREFLREVRRELRSDEAPLDFQAERARIGVPPRSEKGTFMLLLPRFGVQEPDPSTDGSPEFISKFDTASNEPCNGLLGVPMLMC
mmetsp:Transcript_92019/g.168769  ORF Transcript_92019/g.168769 Transcript_92019/m.168769 type:complete len:110 (-) Transcript_92019:478-807(-)